MKKIKFYMAIGLTMSLVLSGCTKEAADEVKDAVVAMPESYTEASGKVVVEESTSVSIDFPAIVEEVYVKEGDKVTKGTPLFKLNLEDYNNLLEQKRNERKLYEMERGGVEKIGVPQTSYIAQLTDQLESKENALKEQTDSDIIMLENSLDLMVNSKEERLKDYATAKELLEMGAISQKEISTIEQEIRSQNKEIDDLEIKIQETKKAKQEEIDNLKVQIKELKTQVGNTEETNTTTKEKLAIQIANVDLQIQSMEKKLQKPYLKDGTIIATEDEILIYDIALQKGTKTEGLMTPAYKTMDLTKRVVEADVPEAYSDQLQVGSKVKVIPYVNEEKILEGTVIRIREQVVENYGETVVKMIIEVKDTEKLLKVGSSVDIQF